MKLNVGCGRNIMEGWTNLDSYPGPGVDIVKDMDAIIGKPVQFVGGSPPKVIGVESADEFLLSHVIEHIRNPLPMMELLWHVAKPGALMTVRCPYGSTDDADEDPTHVRRMYPGSFGYFGQPYYWRADYGYRGDWEIDSVLLYLAAGYRGESPGSLAHSIRVQRNVVREMVVQLHAVKPIREPLRELQKPLPVFTAFASY